MPLMSEFSVDEVIITTMARQLKGEVLVSSVTAFGSLAAHLAKRLYAPDLAVLSTPESGMDVTPMPTLTLGQFLTDVQQGIPLTMEDIFDAIFTDHFRIWINPSQIDQYGNTNITCIGDWSRPKVALVGARGIPEDTSHLSETFYYILNHSPRSVVQHVDFRSGAGNGESRQHLGPHGAPTTLVTDLGVFDFRGPQGQMTIKSLHPGVSLEEVQERTGFPIGGGEGDILSTPPPTADDIRLIREADPLEVRKLELMSGPMAAEKFVNIYERERQTLHATYPRVGKLGRG
ncbi:MAG: CoA-transferase [Sulfobacillus acidophilus]|uniref:CoA-transferase n=1 Tax=Sulfobacillus acidophilus TaxID=53633 RepID=A0A2T2WKU4_9FIRM|nr:MAG: CoA-transferase [Sulfobacillus acidophilus]